MLFSTGSSVSQDVSWHSLPSLLLLSFAVLWCSILAAAAEALDSPLRLWILQRMPPAKLQEIQQLRRPHHTQQKYSAFLAKILSTHVSFLSKEAAAAAAVCCWHPQTSPEQEQHENLWSALSALVLLRHPPPRGDGEARTQWQLLQQEGSLLLAAAALQLGCVKLRKQVMALNSLLSEALHAATLCLNETQQEREEQQHQEGDQLRHQEREEQQHQEEERAQQQKKREREQQQTERKGHACSLPFRILLAAMRLLAAAAAAAEAHDKALEGRMLHAFVFQ
ncbi:hypothetical protein cyc_08497 [Cyclospora cayetanensis]|uniref:Uncharacterized protein n=1 Tax=Cyclospora cayetanensis TaxID=88456 RepID=A0A1D3D2U1_9EIME|nr:hypothetical protein cyc_08497 [Cyclospora cayetanensis]